MSGSAPANRAWRSSPTCTRPKSDFNPALGAGRVRAAFLLGIFALCLALPGCAGPLAALSLVPWTPLLSATLASRGGDPETRKLLNELQAKGDWPGVIRLAEAHLRGDPANTNWLLVL